MFNFGLFATHTPYVIFMLAYVVYFGANLLNHPEDISYDEDGLIDVHASFFVKTTDNGSGTTSFYSNEREGVSAEKYKQPPLYERVHILQKAYFRDKLKDHQLISFHFSRPPPHFKWV